MEKGPHIILALSALGILGSLVFLVSGPDVVASELTNNTVTENSSISVTVTVDTIDVDVLLLSVIPLGIDYVYPGESASLLLGFRIQNYFLTDKSIESVTLRDASRGAGTSPELLTNIDSIAIYLDVDNDSLLTVADSILAITSYDTSIVTLSFAPFTIHTGTADIFLIGVNTNLYPRDGDSLDIFLVTATDIMTSDSTMVTGPDTANSVGYNIVNGMVADQLTITPTGTVSISPGDTVFHVLTIDIPRNGYMADILRLFSVQNLGTADEFDIDSLYLYLDNGNNVWGGTAEETSLGEMEFTGAQWAISGLSVPLVNQTARFYVGSRLSAYAANNSTVALSIPENGIQVSSQNDGPVDMATAPVDTITIVSSEVVTVTRMPISSRTIIPGQSSGPILGIELTNSYVAPVSIDSIRCNLLAIDPDTASQAQLDGQIDSLMLYMNLDGDYEVIGLQDTLLSSATLSNGVILFDTPGLTIAGRGGVIGLSAVAMLNLDNAKNENLINMAISDSAEIFISPSSNVAGNFPLQNNEDFIIDAFPAANLDVNTVTGRTFYGGQSNLLAFDFVLPGNGYAPDILNSLTIANAASFVDPDSHLTVSLWADLTDNGFTVDDSLLGQFSFSAPYWELTDLDYPILSPGKRFLATLDIANNNFDGGTLRFQIPVGGAGYSSGMTGPDDAPVGNPDTHLIFPSNRITVIGIPETSVPVLPGSSDNDILTFALYNGYIGQHRTLEGLWLTNISASRSSQAFADYELGQVSLYYDSDLNRIFSDDSLLAAGYFSNGRLRFSGLDLQLDPDSLSYFFVVIDIPEDVIDLDSLAVSVSGPSDFIFSESVAISGDLPLESGGYLIIDGSVQAQYEILPTFARTLSPCDTSIVLLAIDVASNGDQPDTLTSFTTMNLMDADTSDISSLELWIDVNGDNIWQSSDSLLDTFTYSGLDWTASSLSLEVVNPSPTLFILGDIDTLATPDVAFRGGIPLNGCQYASGNDGPHDNSLTNSSVFTISNSGLRISYDPLWDTRSVSQQIEVRITATNVSQSPIDSVYGVVMNIDNPATVNLDSSISGPVNLPAGDSIEFAFYYTAVQPGIVTWQLRAYSPSAPDSSATIQTNSVNIQSSPTDAMVNLIDNIPTMVTRGQTNVFPLILKYNHPDTSLSVASLRLDSLRIDVEDGTGSPLAANDVFSRIVLATRYTNLVIMENVVSQSSVWLVFANPVIVNPRAERRYTLMVDIDGLATANDFALAFGDAGAIPIVDNNTLQPVTINPGVVFPLLTASCRIDDPSQQMAVSCNTSYLDGISNYGQRDDHLFYIRIRHPGAPGSSQIQLTGFSFQVADMAGNPVSADSLLDQVTLKDQQFVVGELTNFAAGGTTQAMQLSSPVTLNTGEIDSLELLVSISQDAIYDGFEFIISDSTDLVVRDLSSGSLLETVTDTMVVLSGSAFPMTTGWIDLNLPAIAPEICLTSMLPVSIVGGVDSLSLINLAIAYISDSSFSSVRLRNAMVTATDSLGSLLDPNRLFDRIGYRISGGSILYQQFVDMMYGSVIFSFSDTGIVLHPGDSIGIDFIANLEADVPYDHFVLSVRDPDEILLRDAADSSNHPGITITDGCNTDFPFYTDITQVFFPAGRPVLESQSLPVQIGFPGQIQLAIFEGILSYSSSSPQGDLTLDGLRGQILKRTPDGLSVVSGNSVFRALRLFLDNQEVGFDSVFSGDSVAILVDGGYDVTWGDNLPIAIYCDIKSAAILGNYVISFDDSTFLEIYDKDLGNIIFVTLGSNSYPLLTAEISISDASLKHSFSNYPNPFIPSLGEITTIGFVLAEDAYIDITIYTITGEKVKEIAENSFRIAGPHQIDTWAGVNDMGYDVISGTYICQIIAKYVSGKKESFMRKIAVIQ